MQVGKSNESEQDMVKAKDLDRWVSSADEYRVLYLKAEK